jgi:hypothetical protein
MISNDKPRGEDGNAAPTVSATVEAVAGAIARIVPLEYGSFWAPHIDPRWPRDYSPSERKLRYEIAREAVRVANLSRGEP